MSEKEQELELVLKRLLRFHAKAMIALHDLANDLEPDGPAHRQAQGLLSRVSNIQDAYLALIDDGRLVGD